MELEPTAVLLDSLALLNALSAMKESIAADLGLAHLRVAAKMEESVLKDLLRLKEQVYALLTITAKQE